MTIQTPLSPLASAADQRSAQILSAVRRAFAEKGFDGASMQDLARAAGISVGNFYRYFPSKAAIVAALVTQDLAELEQDFATIIGSPRPMEELRDTLRRRISAEACSAVGSLWAEIAAASHRKPEICDVTGRMEHEVEGYLLAIFARTTGLAESAVRLRFGAHAQLIVMLVKACTMQVPDRQRDTTEALVMRTIDGLLDEVRAAGRPDPKSRDM